MPLPSGPLSASATGSRSSRLAPDPVAHQQGDADAGPVVDVETGPADRDHAAEVRREVAVMTALRRPVNAGPS